MRTALLVTLLVLPSVAAAQKNCRKGIPCGNTCISASKTCHIESAPSREPDPAPVRLPKVRPAPTLPSLDDVPDAPWFAAKTGSLYYRNVPACMATSMIAPEHWVRFATEDEAKATGRTRAKSKNC